MRRSVMSTTLALSVALTAASPGVAATVAGFSGGSTVNLDYPIQVIA